MSDEPATVQVTRKGATRLLGGHPWVFRSDVARAQGAEAGEIVRVTDRGGQTLGHAFYSDSELALRLLTRGTQAPGPGLLRERIAAAIERRGRLLAGREALRLVHGEADLLPGLLVDRFGPGVVVQTLCRAMDRREAEVVAILVELLRPEVVVLRDDGSPRDFEALPRHRTLAHGGQRGALVRYREGEIRFEIDLLEDQKTGAFLDQHDNHLLAGQLARGRALDLFCYHGGFGLQMARRAESVLGVEIGEAAAQRARRNAADNGIDNLELRCANAFDLLRELEQERARFDVIVIDPPAFARRKSGLQGALRGYKDLNLRALRLLAPGGLLVSCSCSGRVTPPIFEQMLLEAARDVRRSVTVLARRGAGPDHPGLLGVPETEYLKCFVLQAL